MSRSNNTELTNPATRFFEWSGSEGCVRYYDKETEQNVTVKLPFRFLVLDRVAQVAGGIDRDGTYYGFWSNQVRSTKNEPFVVRSKQGVEASGYYEQIKATPGVKFMTGLYVAFYDESGALQIGMLKVKGAALTAWIEFTKDHKDIYKGAFSITGNEKQKKGATTYYSPVFAFVPTVKEETEAAAVKLDKELQTYLAAYFATAPTQAPAPQFAAAQSAPAYTGGNDWSGHVDLAEANDDDGSIPF
jgi:hypothetical protein